MSTQLRSLLACSAVVALSAIGATGCGDAGKSSGSTLQGSTSSSATGGAAVPPATSTASLALRDGDGDNDGAGSHNDADNDANPTYGPAADAADRQAITTLLKRYYTAAAAGDGATACSLTYWLSAERIVEEHHRGRGPPSLRGNTCAQVASKLFEQRHSELTENIATLQVTVVQIHRNSGFVVLRFGVARERLVLVHRANGIWKMNVLLDNGPL